MSAASATLTPEDVAARARAIVDVAARAGELEEAMVLDLECAVAERIVSLEVALDTLRRLLNAVGGQKRCKGCGAAIWFVGTVSGSRPPYNAVGLNHFADCPNASRFRGARR